MYNPRNAYQNYPAATNSTNKTIYTYMGTLLPNYGNITYSTSGELSPLLNDPYLRTIGVGTRIFLGGGIGYVAWQGTQHKVEVERSANGVPVVNAATLAVIGDIKQMSTKYVRGAVFDRYGVTLFVGIGVPIPILDEEMLKFVSVKNSEIYTKLVDKSGNVNIDKKFNYAELRSGTVKFNGKNVHTAPLSSSGKNEVGIILNNKQIIKIKHPKNIMVVFAFSMKYLAITRYLSLIELNQLSNFTSKSSLFYTILIYF